MASDGNRLSQLGLWTGSTQRLAEKIWRRAKFEARFPDPDKADKRQVRSESETVPLLNRENTGKCGWCADVGWRRGYRLVLTFSALRRAQPIRTPIGNREFLFVVSAALNAWSCPTVPTPRSGTRPVVFREEGRLRPAGRVDMTRSDLEGFGRSLTKEDEVVVEATSNSMVRFRINPPSTKFRIPPAGLRTPHDGHGHAEAVRRSQAGISAGVGAFPAQGHQQPGRKFAPTDLTP